MDKLKTALVMVKQFHTLVIKGGWTVKNYMKFVTYHMTNG